MTEVAAIAASLGTSLAFVDTETTGLNPIADEVVEIAVIRVDPDGTERTFHTFVCPTDVAVITRYLGWTPPESIAASVRERQTFIATAPYIADVADDLLDILDGCVLVGQNVGFDEVMLNASLFKAGDQRRVPYHKIDTKTLAFEHLFPEGLTSASMDPMRKHLGLSTDGAHTAMKDTLDVIEVFIELFRRA